MYLGTALVIAAGAVVVARIAMEMSPEGSAFILQVNVFEEPPWIVTPDDGVEDAEGVVWLR